MASLIPLVGDAVVAAINAGGGFGQNPAVTAVRSYVPRSELKDLANLKVTVVPTAIISTPDTRSKTENEVTVFIGIQKHLTDESDSALDVLVTFAQDIATYMNRKHLTLTGGATAFWTRTAHDPVLATSHIDQKKVFTSVITMTYRIWTGE